MRQRPVYAKSRHGYRMCQWTTDGARCSRQACWEAAEKYLCLTHVRELQDQSTTPYEVKRIAWPVK